MPVHDGQQRETKRSRHELPRERLSRGYVTGLGMQGDAQNRKMAAGQQVVDTIGDDEQVHEPQADPQLPPQTAGRAKARPVPVVPLWWRGAIVLWKHGVDGIRPLPRSGMIRLWSIDGCLVVHRQNLLWDVEQQGSPDGAPSLLIVWRRRKPRWRWLEGPFGRQRATKASFLVEGDQLARRDVPLPHHHRRHLSVLARHAQW